MSDWDPAATALLRPPRSHRPGAPSRGDLRALAHRRIAQDLLREPPPSERAHRRDFRPWSIGSRASQFPRRSGGRWSRRSVSFAAARSDTAAQVLSQLVAPARDTGGAEAGDAVAQAARSARAAARTER